MTTSTANAWPALSSDNEDSSSQHPIHWETVRTEEEEYLDKLQSKLSRVMANHSFQSTKNGSNAKNRYGGRETSIEPDEIPEGQNAAILAPREVDDEGLHLLYEYARLPPTNLAEAEAQSSRPDATPLQPIPSSSSSQPFTIEVESPGDVQGDVGDTPTPRRTVRFRSRVRITSGIHSMSASSSTSGSPASSISVPLRGSGAYESKNIPATDAATASLSEMLPSQATNAWLNELAAANRERRRQPHPSPGSSLSDAERNERTPLRGSRRRMYTEPDDAVDGQDEEIERIRGGARKSEEQVMFGKWPWRLLKWQWWWWKLEPIVCCCDQFDDESDTD